MNYQRIDAQKLFPSVKQRLFSVYRLFGYEELSLPLFEQYEKYLQYKAVSDETLLKIIDRTGNILVLRPDATFHVLKTIGSMNFSENRYCYMTNVFRFKENNYEKNDIMQAGVELFNAPSAHADAEIIAVAIESLKALGIDDIHFDLGHSKFVHQFLKEIGITKESDIIYYHSLIENKNLVALSDLLYKEKITSEHIDLLCNIAMLFGEYQTVLDKAGALCINKNGAVFGRNPIHLPGPGRLRPLPICAFGFGLFQSDELLFRHDFQRIRHRPRRSRHQRRQI